MVSIRIALCLLEIHIPGATSLKQKRQVVESMVKRLRNRFNFSVAEVGYKDLWQRSELAVAGICQSSAQADRVMEQAISFVERENRVEIISIRTEVY